MNLNDRIEQLKDSSAEGIKTVRYDGFITAISCKYTLYLR
jgi:hypothetical protein